MSARRVSSEEALRIGLVNRLYPPDQLREQTYAYARDLADFVSPSAIAVIKRQLYDVPFQTLAEATIDANREMQMALQRQRFPGRAWRALWRSGRRGLRGSRGGGSMLGARSPSSPFGLCRARFALRATMRGCATRSPKGEAWWSQAGSNRRPRHCERRALPAELWPHRDRLNDPKRPAIGAIYNPRQGQVKNGEIADFRLHLPGTSLVCGGMEPISSGKSNPRPTRESSPPHARRSRHRSHRSRPLCLASDRFRHPVLADRLQCREHAQPVRGGGGRVPVPDHRAGCWRRSASSCPIWAGSISRRSS